MCYRLPATALDHGRYPSHLQLAECRLCFTVRPVTEVGIDLYEIGSMTDLVTYRFVQLFQPRYFFRTLWQVDIRIIAPRPISAAGNDRSRRHDHSRTRDHPFFNGFFQTRIII